LTAAGAASLRHELSAVQRDLGPSAGRDMDLHFNCTQCGRCCRNLKLPLTAAEAVAWLAEGHEVQLISEAMPWLEEPAVEDPKAAHRPRDERCGAPEPI
jgi:Fe-S-cluster containining protein